MSHGFYNIISFGGRALPAPVAELWTLGSMRVFTVIVLFVSLCGCRDPKSSSGPIGMWRLDDSHFSQREQQMIASAKEYLEKEYKKPVDGYYFINSAKDGYAVTVTFVTRYENGHPVFVPGGHCIVLLREDGSVIRVLPGA